MLFSMISLAFSFEGMAVLLLSKNEVGFYALIAVYAVHAAGSLALAVAVWATLPASMRQPRAWMLTFLFTTNFFVPLLPVLMCIATWLGYRYRQLHEDAPVVVITEPEYSIYRATTSMKSRGGRTRTKLTNLDVPVPDRLTALLAIEEAPARVSADLLRDLLADPIEDIRLLAYGMIDGKEKNIGVRILDEESKLEDATEDDVVYGCNKRLAELHWELVYQKLVQGDMMRHACEQSRKHAQIAVDLDEFDAGLWFLLTRVAIELRDLPAAETNLAEAARRGFPSAQLVPYRAELAFLQRRFEDVPRIFGELTAVPGALRLASVYTYWTRHG